METAIDITTKAIVLLISLFSIIFTSGVVWRVEKKLDTSYKLFLLAIIFFLTSEVLSFDNASSVYFLIFANIAKILFAVFFLLGILEMRSLIRDMDGEK